MYGLVMRGCAVPAAANIDPAAARSGGSSAAACECRALAGSAACHLLLHVFDSAARNGAGQNRRASLVPKPLSGP